MLRRSRILNSELAEVAAAQEPILDDADVLKPLQGSDPSAATISGNSGGDGVATPPVHSDANSAATLLLQHQGL
jgi:hypothetical protein